MLFRRNYEAPGPGIDPEAPEKTGWRRLMEIFGIEAATLFQLNLLFLVSCLPVVTIPPAIYAMNHILRRMVLDQPVDLWYQYRQAFRRLWKRGYAAFFLTVVPLVLSGYGASFYLRYAADNYALFLPFMLCSTIFLVVLLSSTYLYGVLSTGRSVRESLRLALILGVGKPLRGLLAVLSVYGVLLICIIEFPISAGFLILIGFSVPGLLANFFLRTVLRQFCGEQQLELDTAGEPAEETPDPAELPPEA
jgi:uncharacterized membrane protein YesL